MDLRLEGREVYWVRLDPRGELHRSRGERSGWWLRNYEHCAPLIAWLIWTATIPWAMAHGMPSDLWAGLVVPLVLLAGVPSVAALQTALLLDPDGITAKGVFRRRRIRWSEVEGLEASAGTYRLRGAGVDIWLTAEVARRVRQVLGEEDGRTPTHDLGAADIEALVGLRPGECVTAPVRCPYRVMLVGLAGLACLAVCAASVSARSLVWTLPALVVSVPAARSASRTGPWFRANGLTVDANGLTVGQSGATALTIPWSNVLDVSRPVSERDQAEIGTTIGPVVLRLTTAAGRRLFDIVERVVEARKAGARLPDTTPVPAGAISRMTGESSADRGISEAEVMNEE
ncbi:MAG: PH domain-containing protein [Armatimonadetes bacterium]|nr:PH domain-containing protein [Armatimonadota bacterium]